MLRKVFFQSKVQKPRMVQNNLASSKKGIQILLSLSLLAFISSQCSSLIFTHLSSFKFFSSTTDRHYIFLLCNGLMLLVIKTSGLFSSPTPPATEFYCDSHLIKTSGLFSSPTPPVEFTKENNVEPQIDDIPETKGETNSSTIFVTEVEKAKGDIRLKDQGGEHMTSTVYCNEKEQVNDLNFVDKQEQGKGEESEELKSVNIGEEEEQEIMLWNTEELNKKCDDFIRKMKYGIRLEAPLVMV